MESVLHDRRLSAAMPERAVEAATKEMAAKN
jgi:hypothetical protein